MPWTVKGTPPSTCLAPCTKPPPPIVTGKQYGVSTLDSMNFGSGYNPTYFQTGGLVTNSALSGTTAIDQGMEQTALIAQTVAENIQVVASIEEITSVGNRVQIKETSNGL